MSSLLTTIDIHVHHWSKNVWSLGLSLSRHLRFGLFTVFIYPKWSVDEQYESVLWVYTQICRQRRVCLCFYFGQKMSWLWAHRCLERGGPRKWSSTIALMLWCLQGGVRAADCLLCGRRLRGIQGPLTAKISVRDGLGLTRANTRFMQKDAQTFMREWSDVNSLSWIMLMLSKAPDWLRAADIKFLTKWLTLWLVLIHRNWNWN